MVGELRMSLDMIYIMGFLILMFWEENSPFSVKKRGNIFANTRCPTNRQEISLSALQG
jgi:hypothetical protein